MSACSKVERMGGVDVAKAMSARYALKIAWEAGLRSVILETDCLKVASHLRQKRREHTAFGSTINDILNLAKSCNSFSSSHTKRASNTMAHRLAKFSFSCNEDMIWMKEVPSPIQQYVLNDASLINQ
ncbi:Spike glycoprotein [Bienertia sinuspersici]